MSNIADARLRDFDVLWKAGQHHSVVYMAGYALEAYLKCAICKSLKLHQLPISFEFHDLEALLLYSGFHADLIGDAAVYPSFIGMKEKWETEMRYVDPVGSEIDEVICFNVDRYLNDNTDGLVPRFSSRI